MEPEWVYSLIYPLTHSSRIFQAPLDQVVQIMIIDMKGGGASSYCHVVFLSSGFSFFFTLITSQLTPKWFPSPPFYWNILAEHHLTLHLSMLTVLIQFPFWLILSSDLVKCFSFHWPLLYSDFAPVLLVSFTISLSLLSLMCLAPPGQHGLWSSHSTSWCQR